MSEVTPLFEVTPYNGNQEKCATIQVKVLKNSSISCCETNKMCARQKVLRQLIVQSDEFNYNRDTLHTTKGPSHQHKESKDQTKKMSSKNITHVSQHFSPYDILIMSF